MRIVIVGSGLVGVTSAYFLCQLGHHVIVIDRETGPGRETSFANGALLTPSMSDPWNAPGCWRVLVSSLGRSDSALQLRASALPALTRWGIQFLKNSGEEAFLRNTLSNLRLALYSLKVMAALRAETRINYWRVARGTLSVFRDAATLNRASVLANRLLAEGLRSRALSRQQTLEVEPALEPIVNQLAGAIYSESDETGNAYQFCVELAEVARSQGVEFKFNTEVTGFEVRSRGMTAAIGGGNSFEADRFIVAAGSYSTPLLRRAGVSIPVQPAKGYSVTFSDYDGALRTPVIDAELHVGAVPLDGALRLVGTAEFAGYDRRIDATRVRSLLKRLHNILPAERFDGETASQWCGLRPMSADGVPVIGYTHVPNLLVNTGHGHLGWTTGAGSSRLLADLVSGSSPAIDPVPYSLRRFARGASIVGGAS